MTARMNWLGRGALAVAALTWSAASAWAAPKVILISLDGAKPDVVDELQLSGDLSRFTGLGRLERHGVEADENITATPSLTAVAHIAIATGSTAVHNDIVSNTFHPVAAPIGASLSGFAAPIGGYRPSPLGPAPVPTAEPLWVRLRGRGLKVATATWPGSDGADIAIAGTVVQPAVPVRTNDYTVPFGAFGGLGAIGFSLTSAAFSPAPPPLVAQLAAAGHTSFSPVQVTTNPLETVFCGPAATVTCGTTNAGGRTIRYDLKLAALDTVNDGTVAYDTLVAFDAQLPIPVGPYTLPSTGPARFKVGGDSAKFFFEGSGAVVGAAYFATHIAPDLSTVRLARYGANFIPRNAAVLSVVDDINHNVGFWAPQPDFRIPEKLSPGFDAFPDLELEDMYRDQVGTFVDYQTQVALWAMSRVPDADLLMVYIEQPDGSGHTFTLTDPRQASDPRDKTSIGRPGFPAGATGQDRAKVRRYAQNLKFAYQTADRAVERIVQAAGVNRHGEPESNVFVVSDHGMAPFHSAVNLRNLLGNAGVDLTKIGIRTSGPAAHIYVNLAGRESGGSVPVADYQALVDQIAGVLRGESDGNDVFNPRRKPLFSSVVPRRNNCGQPGFCTDERIGQDSGDVLAIMAEGYNFDGQQAPIVPRLDDPAVVDPATIVYSVPNFYGAHGHDSELRSMSAIFFAAGPSIKHRHLESARNIDVAPTILKILGVQGAPTIDGRVLDRITDRH